MKMQGLCRRFLGEKLRQTFFAADVLTDALRRLEVGVGVLSRIAKGHVDELHGL